MIVKTEVIAAYMELCMGQLVTCEFTYKRYSASMAALVADIFGAYMVTVIMLWEELVPR